MAVRRLFFLFIVLFLVNPVLANDIVKIFGDQIPDSTQPMIGFPVRIQNPHDVYVPHAIDYDSLDCWPSCGGGKCVHVDVAYYPGGWNGFAWWMGYTPMPAADEEPNIVVSHDRRNWDVPTGGSSPIDSLAIGNDGYMSDVDLCFGMDDKLWVGYREFQNNDEPTEDSIFIYCKSTEDGSTWTARDTILEGDYAAEDWVSPSWVIWNGKYRMYYIQGSADPRVMRFREATEFDGTYGSYTTCSFDTLPPSANRQLWHINIISLVPHGSRTSSHNQDNSMLLALISMDTVTSPATPSCYELDGLDYTPSEERPMALFEGRMLMPAGSNTVLYLAISYDGENFIMNPNQILYKGASGKWDDNNIYRSAAVPIWESSSKFKLALWYPGHSGTYWQVGYTELYFSKQERLWNWDWSAPDPGDSVTVWRTGEYKHWFTLKMENESAQPDQYDTLFLFTVTPDCVPIYFDSTDVHIDSLVFYYKTSDADTLVSGVNFLVTKQTSWNADTVHLYLDKSKASTSWDSLSLSSDDLNAFSADDYLVVYVIGRVDASEWVTIRKPGLFYRKQ